ncbi:MAG: hypothetical protein ACODAE_04865 [Gemmatimonadota bacterium]
MGPRDVVEGDREPASEAAADRRAGSGGSRGRSRRRLSASELELPERVECPFCDGDDTELHSAFGSALSVATYWCNRCRTAFEWIKWDER